MTAPPDTALVLLAVRLVRAARAMPPEARGEAVAAVLGLADGDPLAGLMATLVILAGQWATDEDLAAAEALARQP